MSEGHPQTPGPSLRSRAGSGALPLCTPLSQTHRGRPTLSAAIGILLIAALAACQPLSSPPAPPSPTATVGPKTAASIVYVGNDYNVYLYDKDALASRPLTDGVRLYTWPVQAPTGKAFALSAFTDAPGFAPIGVYIAGESGPSPFLLRYDPTEAGVAFNPATPHDLHWSPDGQHLAFLTWDPQGQRLYLASVTDLRLLSYSGSTDTFHVASASAGWEIQNLGVGPATVIAWSPDSHSLLRRQDAELARIDLPSLQPSVLESRASPLSVPAWSPDGTLIAYVASGRGGDFLFVAQPNRADRRQLARVTGIGHLLWSPDGGRIALGQSMDAADGFMQSLQVVDVAAGQATTLATGPLVAFFWSPDGGRLAYATTSSDGMGLLWRVITPATGQSVDLAAFVPTGEELALLAAFDRHAGDYTPWSPDGTQLLFAGGLPLATSEEAEQPPRVFSVSVENSEAPQEIATGRLAAWTRP